MDVAAHYDGKATNLQRQPRTQLQKYHNLAKRALLSMFGCKAERLLDLACGRGGDIAKWITLGIKEVVGLDISKESIEEAQRRYVSAGSPFNYTFTHQDVCAGYLDGKPFDIVTCMFAMHYFFDTEAHALSLFHTASSNLKLGGVFVGIVPDALQINEYIKHGPFDNGMMQVCALWAGQPACFGSKYACTIQGTVTERSIVHEYLVYGSVLEKIALLYGMEPVPIHHTFFDPAPPLHRLRPQYGEPYASCTALFGAFAFKKVHDMQPK